MSWDDIKENKSEFAGKIEAGKSIKIHILGGEPTLKVTHFIDKKPQPCGGKGCELCAGGHKRKKTYSISAYIFENKKEMLFEQGQQVWDQIIETKDIYGGDLSGVDLVITRKGAGPTDTDYKVVAVPTQFKPEMVTAKAEEVPF